MQDELDENQNKTDEELKRLGFGLLVNVMRLVQKVSLIHFKIIETIIAC